MNDQMVCHLPEDRQMQGAWSVRYRVHAAGLGTPLRGYESHRCALPSLLFDCINTRSAKTVSASLIELVQLMTCTQQRSCSRGQDYPSAASHSSQSSIAIML